MTRYSAGLVPVTPDLVSESLTDLTEFARPTNLNTARARAEFSFKSSQFAAATARSRSEPECGPVNVKSRLVATVTESP